MRFNFWGKKTLRRCFWLELVMEKSENLKRVNKNFWKSHYLFFAISQNVCDIFTLSEFKHNEKDMKRDCNGRIFEIFLEEIRTKYAKKKKFKFLRKTGKNRKYEGIIERYFHYLILQVTLSRILRMRKKLSWQYLQNPNFFREQSTLNFSQI